jgi:hypothetical protein
LKKRKIEKVDSDPLEELQSLLKNPVIDSDKNHIYFYTDVTQESCLDLNRKINDLNKELDTLMKSLKPCEKYKNVVIVRSNHDDFLDRWLKNEDWKKQPTFKNAPLYMELSARLLKQYGKGNEHVIGVIPELIKERFPKYITLDRSASYKVKGGWELGQHGDISANGSRGSLINFRKLNTKIIVGHYHTPGRKDGALSVGTSTKLRVGYNIGPSSWLQSHVIIHNDGKAQHINFIHDKNGIANFTTFI